MTDMYCDPIALAAPGVSGLQPYHPGKPESELRRELGLERIVKLASNENSLGPSPAALGAARACLSELARYPDGNGFELKTALAEHLGVDRSWLTLGNGSNDVLDMVARTFLAPGFEAVCSEHAFAVYPIVTLVCGGRPRVCPANPPDHAMPYGHDLDAMGGLIDERTRIVFIANPNNPTGTWLKADALRRFLASLPSTCMAVVDEAYFEYVTEVDYPDTVGWVERFSNLIVTRTFSKAYGLAGLRVGYAVSHPRVADLLNRVRHPFNVNTVGLAAATAALGDIAFLDRSRAANAAGMDQLRAGLAELGLGCVPSVGNFLCLDVGRSGQEVFSKLLQAGVIVRPIDNYGLPNHLRVSVGTEPENRWLLEALARALAS
jgi:histidinol-phosphate aminotransferase